MAAALTTDRLLLRRWRDQDREPFQKINGDPRVMEFLAGPMPPFAADQLILRIERHFDTHGFGFFAAELRETGALIGFIGISIPPFNAPFMPAVEIGWRLAADVWDRGLATEGASAVLGFAFETVGLDGVVSFTVPANQRSRRVMEKLGMTHNPAEDFEHGALAHGHPLRQHVLYRLSRAAWESSFGSG